jgi:Bacterial membrane protein YfhO
MLTFVARLPAWVRQKAAPLAVLAVLWLAFFWRVLTPVMADRMTFQRGDFTLQFLAYRQMAYAQFSRGLFPVLEECLYAGHPFQADPQAQVLYPPVLGLMLLGRALGWQTYPLRALEWEVMAHVLLAALGMYAFLRDDRLTRLAAIFGASAFAYSGYMTGYAMLQTGILETAAWLPLFFLALRRLLLVRRWAPWACALAALGAVSLTAGHPQTLLFMLYAGAAYGWVHVRQSRSMPGAARRVAVAALLGIGLAAAQLVPSLMFMVNSTRAGLGFDAAGRGFALQDIALFALTGVANVWQPLYVGIATLVLAMIALIRRVRRDTMLWLWLAIGALVISFGANAFGFDLFYLAAPGYRQFQSQERHALVVTFALSMLGAYGAHALLGPLRARARSKLDRAGARMLIGAALAFAATLAVITFGASIEPPRPDIGTVSGRTALLTLALLGSGALLTWRARLGATQRRLWGAALLALLVFDVFSANRSSALQKLAEPFPALALLEPIRAGQAQNPNAPFERVYNHFGLPLNGACVNDLSEIGGGSPIVWRDYAAFLERTPEDVLVKLLNVRHAVTWRGAMTTPSGVEIPWFLLARGTFEGKQASTYRLDWQPTNTRGAWVAPVLRVADDKALYRVMTEPGFDPFAAILLAEGDAIDETAGTGSAAVEGKAAGYIKLAANTTGRATLAISEAYHPNWVALVNGREVRPLRVYGALLGVPLTAGASTIELSYRPLDFYAGLGVSALTLFVMAGLILTSNRHEK